VRLLLDKNQKCYRPRRTGERRRKSIRGCIVGNDIAVLALAVAKKGEKEIQGLTDLDVPRHLGPKRANKIRKLFSLKKDEYSLVKKYVVRRKFTSATGKSRQKAPKIQRLITDVRLSRKNKVRNEKKNNYKRSLEQAESYKKLVHAKFASDKKDRKASSRKASERKAS
jgi:small subunit ribosomal protein S6e